MEQYRDEHLVCASCGESFFFSAGEARIFAERSLAAPKRCKECRRVRREQEQQGAGPARGAGGAVGGGGGGGFRGGARPQRFTGDVNEYRSPMAGDGFVAPRSNGGDRGPAGRRPGAPMGAAPANGTGAGPRRAAKPSAWGRPAGQPWASADGVYRSPMSQNDQRPRAAARPPESDEVDDAPMPAKGPAQTPPRHRPPAETFPITCSSCGETSQVPFKPAEGREIFCQPCYRARKPLV